MDSVASTCKTLVPGSRICSLFNSVEIIGRKLDILLNLALGNNSSHAGLLFIAAQLSIDSVASTYKTLNSLQIGLICNSILLL